jgi:CO/xanthine dehydrogenase Mo-binding subunit
MARMIRKQIYLEPEQDKTLKAKAKALGISTAELIRRRITEPGRGVASYPTRPEAWEEELHFIAERARLADLKKTRGWTRDELYEERLGRFSR